ncbi:MAG: response regulator transcription factor [Candidatus Obscuribacterales bacterium]|nr:response regulator transcription factor [Candidatus Obscuribacterales bacterium]
MRILLAEDDKFLSDGLSMVLKDNGYVVDIAYTGSDADIALTTETYDLLILDLGLPKMDGLEVLKRTRNRGQLLPVLILTARDRLEDCVSGLDLGANDYMTKPFQLPELEARIRALLRKDAWSNRTDVTCGKISFNTVTREVTAGGEALELSARELGLLEIMLQRAGRIVDKEQIIASLGGWDVDLTYNAIGISVHRLRKKLEPHGVTIKALRGLGYRIEETD